MLALFTLTVLVSATLLFLVQPMFARMVLPLLGGSPAVWNTALVFYQATLLAGYAYAHLLTGRLRPRVQAAIHVALVLAAFAMPIAVPLGWQPPTDHSPIGWMLALLAVGVGLPFFVVSTTGPLIQRWFSAGTHRHARDPYFLYAASNAGSMAGLLSYPLLIEPALRLPAQRALWTAGYGVLAVLVAACALAAWRWDGGAGREVAAADAGEAPAWPRRLRWLLLAFIPSSLMIGVTTHITTDVAAIPLLWVLPLALYLLSFVLVFARRQLIPHAVAVRLLPIAVLPLLIVMEVRAANPLPLIVALHLLMLFLAALVCHGELAHDRPPAARLTEFYLWLALGGALGGGFNALLAPVLFHSVLEYPIAIVLVCLALPPRRPPAPSPRARVLDVVLPVLIGGIVLGVFALFETTGLPFGANAVVVMFAVLAFPLYAFSARPLRFALAIAAILITDPSSLSARGRAIHQERTFFGVHRVVTDQTRHYHELIHGTTLHGKQRWAPKDCGEPLGYYHREGPAGDVFAALGRDGARVGLAGLGTGALAAYARPSQSWTFWEIDPAVKRIASDTSWFCYLAASPAGPRVVLGDARRSIAADSSHYDLIVLDAYTSDVIPVHLMTREALQLYLTHLTPHGVIAFHLSNRYFALEPIVARLAQDARLEYRLRARQTLTDAQQKTGEIWPSSWMVVARAPDDFGALARDPSWGELALRPRLRVWTDDYSSLWSVLR